MKLRIFLIILVCLLQVLFGKRQFITPPCVRVLGPRLCHAQPHCRWSFAVHACVDASLYLSSPMYSRLGFYGGYGRSFGGPLGRSVVSRGYSRPIVSRGISRPMMRRN